ncbi:MAG: bifunctional riboflavin kinase/FAD synthetase [Saprospiraceae bacterium]|nr:bifunctional riboflavin kinase/FAD synthetase [Saprospiraceae bacterium]
MDSIKKNIVTIGSFDGVHLGHQSVLEHINKLANEMNGHKIVVTFDPHPRKVLAPQKELDILTTTEEKIKLLKKYGVDEVVVVPFNAEFANQSPIEYLENFLHKKLNTKYLVIGFDHKFGKDRAGDIHFLETNADQFGINIIEIPPNTLENIKISSTNIRNSILNNEFDNAIQLLGHPYLLSGRVILGSQLGRTIGFPTANISVPESDKLIPENGIYAVKTTIDGIDYKGMLYIGNRPTINDHLAKTIELNIIDFNQDIYERNINIEIISYIRGDKKLENLEALKTQIEADKVIILNKLSTYDLL